MSIRKLLDDLDITPPRFPTPVIMIGDFGKDLDDEQTLIQLLGLERVGMVKVCAVIACLLPAIMRARQAKGICVELGFPNIPVGVGSNITEKEIAFDHETAGNMADESEIRYGADLLVHTLDAAKDHSMVLFLSAGMTDAAKLFIRYPRLALLKIKRVVIMGGVKLKKTLNSSGSLTAIDVALNEDGFMEPDDAANNEFDPGSAKTVYDFCQKNNLPMDILMREAAYACQFPLGELYTDLASTGSPLGDRLVKAHPPSLRIQWSRYIEPAGSELRGTLPVRYNRQWFVETYCLGTDPGEVDDIWPHVKAGQLYDPMTALLVVPSLRHLFFEPHAVIVRETVHGVIGMDRNIKSGIRDADGLRKFISELLLATLKG